MDIVPGGAASPLELLYSTILSRTYFITAVGSSASAYALCSTSGGHVVLDAPPNDS